MKEMRKFKKGAASFYIVAISTLILVIIAASFAAVIISEITRTSNDDLAQSAYDSALAGIEDAKLAYYNYQNCKSNSSYITDSGLRCADVIDWVEGKTESNCDMVANILGRVPDGDNGVPVQEGVTANNMQQYYTCVKITNKTKDVLGTVSESDPEYIVRVKFDEEDSSNVVDKIQKVRVKWHSDSDGESNEFKVANYGNSNEGLFNDQATMPAVVSVGMIQTSSEFNLSDFDMTQGETTNRGTVYLVPKVGGEVENDGRFIDVTSNNSISEEGFLKSNDKTSKNLPYLVNCNGENEYACVVDINIPRPVGGGSRNKDTFMFKVSLPYGGPNTNFSLEFYCGEGELCSKIENEDGETDSDQAILDGVQISIDSTGKANDLYRRIETRLEPEGSASYPYPLYAVQLLGSGNAMTIEKDFYTTSEYNF